MKFVQHESPQNVLDEPDLAVRQVAPLLRVAETENSKWGVSGGGLRAREVISTR